MTRHLTRHPGTDHGPQPPHASELLQQTLDGLPDVVVAFAADHTVAGANAAARELFPGLRLAVRLPGSGALHDVFAADEPTATVEYADRRWRCRRAPLSAGYAWYLRDVTDEVLRTDAILAERRRASFLADASRRLGASLNVDRTRLATLELAVPALADRAVLVSRGRGRRCTWQRTSTDEDGVAAGVAELDDVLAVTALAAAFDGVMVADSPGLAAVLSAVPWLVADADGSALVLPVVGHGRTVGVLVLLRRAGRAGFEPVETDLAGQFAARAGAATASATLYQDQVRVSEVLESSLVPPGLPAERELRLAARYRPAREALGIGGDYYDVFPADDGGGMVVLGDVCGKGVEAAVLTGQVRQTLATLRLLGQDPVTMLTTLNAVMLASDTARFTTLVVAVAEPVGAGRVRLRLASGGHPPPYVLRADGTVELVDLAGALVGILPEPTFGETTVLLEPGDTCLLYTDGVTESRGGPHGAEFFGRDRLADLLAGCVGMPTGALVERVEQVATDWSAGNGHDDIAVLAITPSDTAVTFEVAEPGVPLPADLPEAPVSPVPAAGAETVA